MDILQFQKAKTMPPRYHTLPGKPFNILASEVCKWLIEQPEILRAVEDDVLQFIFNQAVQKKMIVYDKQTGMWYGVNWNRVPTQQKGK